MNSDRFDWPDWWPRQQDDYWPTAWGKPVGKGILRACPEDFTVEEIPRVRPEGHGKHLWLWVEKRAANSAWVARQLAAFVGVAERDVGFAGRKDRHALSRQFFSLPVSGSALPDFSRCTIEGVRILSGNLHPRKLHRGFLAGNHFRISVREVAANQSDLAARLERIVLHGIPNYFGIQRFGRAGKNLAQARKLALGGGKMSRNSRNLALSAVRAFIFNEVLAERIRRGNWNTLLAGDIARFASGRSQFMIERPDRILQQRCSVGELSPTGPLAGAGESPALDAGGIETGVLSAYAAWVTWLVQLKMKSDRRVLRSKVTDLRWDFMGNSVQLAFSLPAGVFATSLIREILQCRDCKLDTA